MVTIRPAEPTDLDAVAAIHTYYVLNTVKTFTSTPHPVSHFLSAYHSTLASRLPYLVAVDEPDSPTVVGYACAHDFRGGAASAYLHTVEITLFCHPDHRGRGVGSALLRKLIAALRDPGAHAELYRHDGSGVGGGEEARVVKEVLAVMAVDEMAEGGGLGLKGFYEMFGFELRGHLRRVGYKFGRWVDTMYLQLSL